MCLCVFLLGECDLYEHLSNFCRDSPTLMMHECRGFEVPEWMLIKIRAAMQALRSDGSKRSRSRSPLSVSTASHCTVDCRSRVHAHLHVLTHIHTHMCMQRHTYRHCLTHTHT